MKLYKFERGFTLIEIMVVVAIIGVLSAVLFVSFSDARANARDSVRQADLKQLQLAIELYKAQNGRYPEQGCGGGTHWTGPGTHPSAWGNVTDCPEYIAGLVPDFIAVLPTDPSFENELGRGFMYNTDLAGTRYKVMIHQTVESKHVLNYNNEFARCRQNYGTVFCGSTPQFNTYAIYSQGAEAW